MNIIIKRLLKLSKALSNRGLGLEARIVSKLASRGSEYTIRREDTLSQIAESHGVSTQLLMSVNNIKDAGSIWAGQTLTIPEPDNAAEVVAATLMGEGGSEYGESMMLKIMTIIVNRSSNTGMSNYEVATHRSSRGVPSFSYWRGKSFSDGVSEWSEHQLWNRALEIARNQETDSSVREATYYFIPGPTAYYKDRPSWADPTNSCWEEVHNDGNHIYGKAGKPWDGCLPE